MAERTSPAAEATERLLDAARCWIDGPGEATRRAALAMASPTFGVAEATATWSNWSLHVARAWGTSAVALVDAIAILAEQPRGFELHEVTAPSGVTFPTQVRVVEGSLQWLAPDSLRPDPVPSVQPSPAFPPGAWAPVGVSGPIPLVVIPSPSPFATFCRVKLEFRSTDAGPLTEGWYILGAFTLRTT